MSPEERFTRLAWTDPHALESLADRILAGVASVEVVDGPTPSVAGLRLPLPGDAGSVVVGHAVVTTCTVLLDGVRGDGARAGRRLDQALAAAICDAEVERGGALAAEVAELADSGEERRGLAARARATAVAATRLDTEP